MGDWDNFLGNLFSSSDTSGNTHDENEDQSPLAEDDPHHKYSTGTALEVDQSPDKPDELPDQSQYDVVSITALDDGQIYQVDTVNGREVLFVDPENAGDARQPDAKASIRDGKEKTGGLSPSKTHPLIAAYHGTG
ncbi:hypothetical protein, partial [Halolamina salina]